MLDEMRNCFSESDLASFEVLNRLKETFHCIDSIAHLKQDLLLFCGPLFGYLFLELCMHLLIAIDFLIEDVLERLIEVIVVELVCDIEGEKVELGAVCKKPVGILHTKALAELLLSDLWWLLRGALHSLQC